MSKKYIIQARIFKAMSDENRLKILELLHEREYNASELLAQMDVDGKSYVAATPHMDDPAEALGADAELIVLVSEEEDGEEYLASIDNDEEYERIGNIFLEKLMGYYEEDEDEMEDGEDGE